MLITIIILAISAIFSGELQATAASPMRADDKDLKLFFIAVLN